MSQVVSHFFASLSTQSSSQSSSRLASQQSESNFEKVLDQTAVNHDSTRSRLDHQAEKKTKKDKLASEVQEVDVEPEREDVPLKENHESDDQLDADEAALVASVVEAQTQQDDTQSAIGTSPTTSSNATINTDANSNEINPLLEAAGQSTEQGSSENQSSPEKNTADAMLKLLGVSTGQAQHAQQAIFTMVDSSVAAIQTDSTVTDNASQNLQLTTQDDVDSSNVSRISRALQNAIQQKGGTITIRMMPPELGQVRVDIVMDGGKVTANFQTESESIQNLMSRELGQLRTALEKQGLTVERLEVTQRPASTNTSNQTQQESQEQHESPSDGRSRGQYAQQQNEQASQQDSDARESSFASELQEQI